MHCPYCRHTDTRVLDSRVSEDGTSIRRRRSCSSCEKRFTTVEAMQLTVVKRSGATEAFSRDKVVRGVRRACQGRPVDDDALQKLAQQVEESIRATGVAEIPSHEVGLAILGLEFAWARLWLRRIRRRISAGLANNRGREAEKYRVD